MKRTEIRAEDLRSRYAAGVSIEKLARFYGVTPQTLRLRMAECGIVPSGNVIPADICEKVVAAYQSGALQREIAQEFGVGLNSITRIIERSGMPKRRPRRCRPCEPEVAIERILAGEEPLDVARDLGVSHATIYQWIKDAGLKKRWVRKDDGDR